MAWLGSLLKRQNSKIAPDPIGARTAALDEKYKSISDAFAKLLPNQQKAVEWYVGIIINNSRKQAFSDEDKVETAEQKKFRLEGEALTATPDQREKYKLNLYKSIIMGTDKAQIDKTIKHIEDEYKEFQKSGMRPASLESARSRST